MMPLPALAELQPGHSRDLMDAFDPLVWTSDWLWGIPLIVLNVIIHVSGLAFIDTKMVPALLARMGRQRLFPKFIIVIGIATLMITVLHAFESITWAMTFYWLDALPNIKLAMLYSLSAITAYGHATLFLAAHWQLMGALEALNGITLFGLTAAYLYAIIQKVWPLHGRRPGAGGA
jgi:hypothetical protein